MNAQTLRLSKSTQLGSVASVLALPLLLASSVQGGTTKPAVPAPAAKPTAKPAATAYHVLKTFDVGGDGGWDYVTIDSDSHRLFIARSTHVMVVDVETGKVVGDIADTPGVHGIALAPEFNRGFTSNGKSGDVTIFDMKTLAPIGSKVKVGDNPDAIMYDPSTKRVFTMNGGSDNTTAIDAATGKVVGTLALDGAPEFAVSDGQGKIFVNLEDKSQIVEFDAKELKALARWPLAPGEEPSGLAIDVKSKRLFSACGNQKMIVLDSDTGKVLANLPIGKGVDAAGFDPSTGCAFASNGDGTLTIVHEDDPSKFSVLENVTTVRSARTMALDLKTHIVYLPSAKSGGGFKVLAVGK